MKKKKKIVKIYLILKKLLNQHLEEIKKHKNILKNNLKKNYF